MEILKEIYDDDNQQAAEGNQFQRRPRARNGISMGKTILAVKGLDKIIKVGSAANYANTIIDHQKFATKRKEDDDMDLVTPIGLSVKKRIRKDANNAKSPGIKNNAGGKTPTLLAI